MEDLSPQPSLFDPQIESVTTSPPDKSLHAGDGGFLIMFDEENRSWLLKSHTESDEDFSDAFSALDWKIKQHEICLISFDQKSIEGVALAERKQKVATARYRVVFTHFKPFTKLPIDAISQKLGGSIRRYFIKASNGQGHRMATQTWNDVIDTIIAMQPDVLNAIQGVITIRNWLQKPIVGDWTQTLSEERDAVGIALEIFGTERQKELRKWSPPLNNEAAPYLQGLSEVVIGEDAMIQHDNEVFDTWERIQKTMVGATIFSRGDQLLTIQNFNRTPIEKTLGVDLLYYHHTYRAYVLVQYKRMRRDEKNRWVYRPENDASYQLEIDRMRAFQKQTPTENLISKSLSEHRLSPALFFFKLCPETIFNPASTEMIKGMYFSLDHWESLLGSPLTRGERGGLRIPFDHDLRYMNNSLFVQLAQDGWIGSRAVTSEQVTSIINQCLLSNREVIYAYSETI